MDVPANKILLEIVTPKGRALQATCDEVTAPSSGGEFGVLPGHLPILASVRRTGRLLVVEEGTAPWGFGAEIIARVAEAMQERGPRCARVAAHHLPIPNARPAEDLVLPDAARVLAAMRALCA